MSKHSPGDYPPKRWGRRGGGTSRNASGGKFSRQTATSAMSRANDGGTSRRGARGKLLFAVRRSQSELDAISLAQWRCG